MSKVQQAHTEALDAAKLSQALQEIDSVLQEIAIDIMTASSLKRMTPLQARYLRAGIGLAQDLIPKEVFNGTALKEVSE